MKASVNITIERGAQDVWDCVADVERRHTWLEGLAKPRRTSEVESGTGAVYAARFTRLGKAIDITYEVIESEPHRRHALRVMMPRMPFVAVIEIAPEGNGARVVYTMDTGSGGRLATVLTTALGPFMRPVMRRQLLKELRGLKAVLEEPVAA